MVGERSGERGNLFEFRAPYVATEFQSFLTESAAASFGECLDVMSSDRDRSKASQAWRSESLNSMVQVFVMIMIQHRNASAE